MGQKACNPRWGSRSIGRNIPRPLSILFYKKFLVVGTNEIKEKYVWLDIAVEICRGDNIFLRSI